MTITERPKAYVYACDGCGVEHVQENALGHYTDSRPDGWDRITKNSGPHGSPTGTEHLLCVNCSLIVESALRNAYALCRESRRTP